MLSGRCQPKGHGPARVIGTWLLISVLVCAFPGAIKAQRVSGGLQALYTFTEGKGNLISDRSGVGRPLNLAIEKPATVKWQSGSLLIRSSTRIASTGPATKLINSIRKSRAVTLEAWIRPTLARMARPGSSPSVPTPTSATSPSARTPACTT